MFKTIVIGYDGSAQAADALELALALADEAGSELVVACIYPYGFSTRLGIHDDAPGARVEAEQRLASAREVVGSREGVRYQLRGATSPARGLHDVCEQEHADLIVVGASHRGMLGRVVPGSVTEQVLHAAPCAVAVAPQDLRRRQEFRLRRVGIAFDGSRDATAALMRAAALARAADAELEVIRVIEPIVVPGVWGVVVPLETDAAAVRSAAADEIAAVVQTIRATPEEVITTVVDGNAREELLIATTRLDLLVLGSRGFGPVNRVLLGTVGGRVVRGAACPVIVVPHGIDAAAVDLDAAAERAAAGG